MAEFSSPIKDRKKSSMDDPGSFSKEQLLCSICLDVFTDPVTTPCGHNFCKSCLTQCWEKSPHCYCPLCKTKSIKKPQLKINTTLRELADHFKKKSSPEKHEVLCDACTGEKLNALKSCLDCVMTLCKSHLEPHSHVPRLKKHKLINPVENLEDYICPKHDRALVLFCRDDQTRVCQFCIDGDHKYHNTVPIEEESRQRKIQLLKTETEVQQMIEERLKKIKEIKHSVKISKRDTEKQKADSVEIFTALIRSIDRSQAALFQVMEEKQKAVERQAEGLIKDLEQEITELKRRDTLSLSHTEEHLHRRQFYSSVCGRPHTKNWTEISIDTPPNGDAVRTALSQLQKNLNEKLNVKLREAVSTELKRIQQYAVDVTLDPDTAHPNLILSADRKHVTDGKNRQNVPDTPQRFNQCPCVLGKQSFSSGRFYYEIQVSGKTAWDLGVVSGNINRKGQITLRPQYGFWTVVLRNENQYQAGAGPAVPLRLREKVEKVGVFVDYDEGLVSFYDVKSCSHIYSFTAQSFSHKLYPFFNPHLNDGGKNSAPLIITPVFNTEYIYIS